MIDSRLTNAYNDLRATAAGITKTAADIEELLQELPPSWQRTSINTAANALAAALDSIAETVESLREAVGNCPHYMGTMPCSGINGHGGLHHNRKTTWDDEEAEQATKTVLAKMGDKTE